ncbi:MAG: hypothetical protein O2964_11215 [Verrucomicrobia bacterium]|jgi:hypothetical protein|nr:hypothetical protein [Verrucomicrobiota bacterium]
MKALFQSLVSDTRTLLLWVVLIILGYFVVLIPVDQKVKSLNRPLEEAWQRLGAAINTNRLGATLDIQHMNQMATDMESQFTQFTDAEAELISRVLLSETDQAKISQPFQLVEFDNALVTLGEQLRREAGVKKVTLEAGVYDGLPHHDVTISEPRLLWADLAFSRYILTLAIECQPVQIFDFQTLDRAVDPEVVSRDHHRLHPSRFRIRMQGTMDAVHRFLRALPLRGSEAEAVGLPVPYWEKPALFVEGILIKKAVAQPSDLVELQLVINGFIYQKPMEDSNGAP